MRLQTLRMVREVVGSIKVEDLDGSERPGAQLAIGIAVEVIGGMIAMAEDGLRP